MRKEGTATEQNSKPIYAAINGDSFSAILWETTQGKILTVKGDLDPTDNIRIKDCKTGDDIKNIDMRNVLIEIMNISR